MIISVPSSLNLSHNSLPSREICTSFSSSGEEDILNFSEKSAVSLSLSSGPYDSCSGFDGLNLLGEEADKDTSSSSSSGFERSLGFSSVSGPIEIQTYLELNWEFGSGVSRNNQCTVSPIQRDQT